MTPASGTPREKMLALPDPRATKDNATGHYSIQTTERYLGLNRIGPWVCG